MSPSPDMELPVRSELGQNAEPPTTVHIQTLGTLSISVNQRVQPASGSRRVGTLVAYLALFADPAMARGLIAADFWPDASDAQRATNLRHLLFNLRQRWPAVSECLQQNGGQLRWNRNVRVIIDAVEFERAARNASEEDDLRRTYNLYHGVFLQECEDAWVLPWRERLHSLWAKTVRRLAELCENRREYPEALNLLCRLTQYDSQNEEDWRRIFRVAWLAGGMAELDRAFELASRQCQEFGEEAWLTELQAEWTRIRAEATLTPRPLFVNRVREWKRLLEGWDSARSGQVTLAWIQGEAGMGKSALASQWQQWAEGNGIRVRRGHASGIMGAPVLEPVREAFRSGPLPVLEQPWQSDLQWVLLRHVTTEASPRIEPGDDRLRRFDALAHALWADSPLVLILEDMQAADDETWEWLRFTLRVPRRASVMVVALSRDDPATMRRRRALFEAVGSSTVCMVVALRPLTPADAELLLRHAETVPPSVIEPIISLAGGNPLFLLEAARAGASAVTSAAGGAEPTVRAVVWLRLSSLPSPQRRLAAAAALMKRAVFPAFLYRVFSSISAMAVEELIKARIFVRDEAGRVKLSHEILGEVLREKWPAISQRKMAARLAQALEGGDGGSNPAERAGLWELAGVPTEAIRWYAVAAEHASQTLRAREAVYLYGRLIVLDPPGKLSYQLRMAQALEQCGETAAARDAYREIFQNGIAEGAFAVVAEARSGLARQLAGSGEQTLALALLDENLTYYRETANREGEARTLVRKSEILGYRSQVAEAEELAETALRLGQESRQSEIVGQSLIQLAYLAFERGALANALGRYREAYALSEATSNVHGVVECAGDLGVVLEETGQVVAAMEYQWRKAELAYSHRLMGHLCYALANLGAGYQGVGAWDVGELCTLAACRLALGFDDMRAISVLANHMAYNRAHCGQPDEAERLWHWALALARAFPLPRYIALYVGGLTEMLLDGGRTADLIPLLSEGWRVRHYAREFDNAVLRVVTARLRHGTGLLSPRLAKERLMAGLTGLQESESRAQILYGIAQITQTADDVEAATEAVGSVLARHPHVRWQQYYHRLTGTLVPLPQVPEVADWVTQLAPPYTDLQPELIAYAESRGVGPA
ncbi:MAG: AAA family ATPase [Thermaerobacter sp.]|nr:AAA family ATPase [Thermaerobacter sp.]